jgi:pimeloyl-ACP methyl ester carboxylesterase
VTPRTPSVIAGELKRVLAKVGASGPFILVGHSFGGLVAQRFALDYPDLVKGLLLLDPLSPHEWHPLSAIGAKRLGMGIALSRRGGVLARLGIVGGALGFLLSGNRIIPKIAARVGGGSGGTKVTDRLVGEVSKLPRELWPVIAFHWSQAKNFEGMARHLEALPESSAEMQGVQIEPRIPVSMIVAATASMPPGLPPYWKFIRAERSGHWVQFDRPDLVLDEVRSMLGREEEPGPR